MNIVYAPWTAEQERNLIAWQKNPRVHSYTCPNRTDTPHIEYYGVLGNLSVHTTGLCCFDCGYEQKWVHDFATKKIEI